MSDEPTYRVIAETDRFVVYAGDPDVVPTPMDFMVADLVHEAEKITKETA